jgi:hypothetical protein
MDGHDMELLIIALVAAASPLPSAFFYFIRPSPSIFFSRYV